MREAIGDYPFSISVNQCRFMTYPLRLFVYGTLKPDERNFGRYCADWVMEVQEAIVYGQLYDLPLGYPAMILGDQPVYGTLLSFAEPKILIYSPHRSPQANEYIRIQRPVFDLTAQPLGLAWVYVMKPQKVIQLGGIRLPAGRWTGRRKTDTRTIPKS
jgi:gamma-glutamylcyclotransferase (GGCT)/AIG2-like uncharacterized protein YtfP